MGRGSDGEVQWAMGGALVGWVGRRCYGWGTGVMGRCKRRWLGFGSDREVQWAVGGARM